MKNRKMRLVTSPLILVCLFCTKVFAAGGRTPAHPKVEPVDPIRPKTIYAVGADDIKQFSKYQKIWKEIFKLR